MKKNGKNEEMKLSGLKPDEPSKLQSWMANLETISSLWDSQFITVITIRNLENTYSFKTPFDMIDVSFWWFLHTMVRLSLLFEI